MSIFLEQVVLKASKNKQAKLLNILEMIKTGKFVTGTDKKEQDIIKNHDNTSAVQDEPVFQYDIMISYCHADKDLVHKIYRFLLDQGFKIWIDLDNMFGPGNIDYFPIKMFDALLLMFSYECYGGGS